MSRHGSQPSRSRAPNPVVDVAPRQRQPQPVRVDRVDVAGHARGDRLAVRGAAFDPGRLEAARLGGALAREEGAVTGAECLSQRLVGRQRAPRPEEPLMEGFVLHA